MVTKISFLLLSLYGFVSQAQINCPNSDFSTGNFNGWSASWGPANNGAINPTQVSGLGGEGNHTIITAPGLDPNTCGNLQMIPPGASYSYLKREKYGYIRKSECALIEIFHV